MLDRICPVCGKGFIPKKGPELTCGRSCGVTLGHRSRFVEPRNECLVCGAEVARLDGMLCSAQCRAVAKRRPCSVDGCTRSNQSREYLMCTTHLRRFLGGRDLHSGPVRLVEGERRVLPTGYVYTRRDGKRSYEHRYVMEQVLGRPLAPNENVHHINGDRADNRLENLELWSKSQPSGQRVADKVAWAIELLQQYGPEHLSPDATQLRLV